MKLGRSDKQALTAVLCMALILAAILICARFDQAEACSAEAVSRQPQVCVIKFTPEVQLTQKQDTPEPTPIPTPEPTPDPLAGYTEEDLMCIANMVYGEISAVCYDKSYTWDEQNQVMQEWASIPLNHIKRGIALTIPGLMKTKTSSGYYIWHPCYATEAYADAAMTKDPAIYERCRTNALLAMAGQMQEPVPDGVIYADLAKHGDTYKKYSIDTGWYRSTVYLCYG